jgi:hypothetical protein
VKNAPKTDYHSNRYANHVLMSICTHREEEEEEEEEEDLLNVASPPSVHSIFFKIIKEVNMIRTEINTNCIILTWRCS